MTAVEFLDALERRLGKLELEAAKIRLEIAELRLLLSVEDRRDSIRRGARRAPKRFKLSAQQQA
jgi:hypothetical protein